MLMQTTKLPLVIDTETTSKHAHEAQMLGFSYHLENCTNWETDTEDPDNNFIKRLHQFYIITQNGKYDAIVLSKKNIKFEIQWDTLIAEYLLHIDKPRNLEDMYERYFGKKKKKLIDLFNEANSDKAPRKKLPEEWWKTTYKPNGKIKHCGVNPDSLIQYAKEDVEATYKIYLEQKKQFEKRTDLYQWFTEIEMNVVNILVKAELKGVKLDLKKLDDLANEVQLKRDTLLKSLLWYCGEKDLNLNSPKQLQEVMFNKLKLPKVKQTKSGAWSTDKKVLEKLKDKAFPKLLLQFNECDDLLSKFLKPLPEKVDSNARLHTTFNQALTDTRRFSSENPNLQNIPAKSDLGKRIRECFVPDQGHYLLVADYDQIELRLLAHFTNDPTLIEAFTNGQDIHQRTADLISKQLGRDFPRSSGKLLNFSLIYGKTAYGFAKDWNCSEEEANYIIDIYFKQFPRVKEWMEQVKHETRLRKSWAKSIAGLPLYICAKNLKGEVLGDINNQTQWVREAAERASINYPIQSSSQDILKTAMVKVYKKYDLTPVLMVHDELLYEIPYDEEYGSYGDQTFVGGVIQEMESAWKLNVPLKVSWKISDRWEK